MIRFYAYYSVGGYKELYLGNNKSIEEFTYFLPLLPLYKEKLEKEANGNLKLREEVEKLSVLPAIMQITRDNNYGLPEESGALFSHDGYSLIYRHLVGNKQVIAIQDIPSWDLDGAGREIPFTFCLICDEKDDWEYMDRIATFFAKTLENYFKKETKETDNKVNELASFLHMDSDTNGLRFARREMVQWLEQSIIGITPHLKYNRGKDVAIHASENCVALLIKPSGMSNDYSLERQEIKMLKVNLIVERGSINVLGEIERSSKIHFFPRLDKKKLIQFGVVGGIMLLIIILLIII